MFSHKGTCPYCDQRDTGVSYRLRFGDFTIEGPSNTTVSTETDPDASSILVDLAAGQYTLTLLDGWVLERDVDGVWEPVEAVLTSPNPTNFEITDQGVTGVLVEFNAAGDPVVLGEGTLDLSIAVDDLVCSAGTASCDGDGTNGCETNLEEDASHCGECGATCPTVPGANPVCSAGTCETECLPSREDCDGSETNGCEANLATSLQNCGGCNQQCVVPNGSPVCQAGSCQVGQCVSGFANCDANAQNGCEFPHNTNPSCANVTFAGNVSGDTNGPPVIVGGNTERRFQIQVNENNTGGSARDLGVRFTLTNPPGASYTLQAGCDGCTTVSASGSGTVTLRWEEQTILGLPTGDSSRPVFVNVIHAGGSSCEDWSLRVDGNVLSGPLTCSAL
jgi:hypothetical protein